MSVRSPAVVKIFPLAKKEQNAKDEMWQINS